VLKTGAINNSGGYAVGDKQFTVDGFIGPIAVGDKFIFPERDKTFEYVVTAHTETTGTRRRSR